MRTSGIYLGTTMAIASIVIFSVVSCQTSPCDDASARLVARAYVLSLPLLSKQDELIPLMTKHRREFLEEGKVIQCMRTLGAALTQGAVREFREMSQYSATERFGGMMPEGLEHLPGQVDASMRSYGSDMFTMGQELLWLSQVLPPAAQGDYRPYNTTGTLNRQMMNQSLQYIQMLCQMDPSICQIMQTTVKAMEPVLEQQIYILARQLSD